MENINKKYEKSMLEENFNMKSRMIFFREWATNYNMVMLPNCVVATCTYK